MDGLMAAHAHSDMRLLIIFGARRRNTPPVVPPGFVINISGLSYKLPYVSAPFHANTQDRI